MDLEELVECANMHSENQGVATLANLRPGLLSKEFLVSHRLLGQMSEIEDAPSLSKSQIRLGSHMSTKIKKIQRPNHQRSPGF
ncbi:unnamed protein product [Caenorhabditis angaria]|uniref:Uncharacterized protein n=1 Tax=Caenorhabditis angaria TaxID=860376 RepID=A0A9P1MT80_9PELO|nr:unnamed protein product [Caenorhabditis angaria]